MRWMLHQHITLFSQFNEREKKQEHKLVQTGFMEVSAQNPKEKKYSLDFRIQDEEKSSNHSLGLSLAKLNKNVCNQHLR